MATYYGRPSDNLATSATWSLAVGSADSAYPLANLNTTRPDLPSKTTGTTATYRATFGASKTIRAIAIIHHNLAGLTLTITNNNGLSTSLVLPANTDDGQPVNGWVDLTSVTTAATQWNIAISGAAANIAIGKILLIETIRTLDVTWGVKHADRHPVLQHRTDLDVALIYDMGVRLKTFEGSVQRESERAAVTALHRGAKGMVTPFWFVPESAVNEAWMVRFAAPELAWQRAMPLVSSTTVALEEACAGLAL